LVLDRLGSIASSTNRRRLPFILCRFDAAKLAAHAAAWAAFLPCRFGCAMTDGGGRDDKGVGGDKIRQTTTSEMTVLGNCQLAQTSALGHRQLNELGLQWADCVEEVGSSARLTESRHWVGRARLPLTRAPSAGSASAWRACGGFGRWQRGGTRPWHHWAPQAQAVQLQDALEVGEQHLDLLPLAL
jgi:hypothetical protein